MPEETALDERVPPRFVQTGKTPGALHKLVGWSVLDDPPVFHDEHSVGDSDGGEAMSNDDRRAIGQQGLEAVLNEPLAGNIERCRRLIENQNTRVGDERAAERHQLTLPRGQSASALVNVGVVTVGKRRNEVVRTDRARCRDHVVVSCVWLAQTNVVGDTSREEIGLLSDERGLLAKGSGVFPEVPPRHHYYDTHVQGLRDGDDPLPQSDERLIRIDPRVEEQQRPDGERKGRGNCSNRAKYPRVVSFKSH